MHHAPENAAARIRYRSRPFVCGAIGTPDPPLTLALVQAAPVEVGALIERDNLVLHISGRTARWRTGDLTGHHWGDLADGDRPRHWRDAAEHRLAAGVETGPAHAALHTDALGMQDLYYRRIGEAVYFASRIEPLTAIGDERLHVDWAAWASTMGLTSPIGDQTPFTEIRRLPAATAWVVRDGRLTLETFEPAWLAADPDPAHSASDVVDALARTIRTTRRTGLTLSGGWDSRLLGILARPRVPRMRAWTTDADDGTDRDLEYSRPVAEALGMRHRVLPPDEASWTAEYTAVRRRTEYQTVHHTWIMPLARRLHRHRAPLLDGLAGDVLFKTSRVSDPLLTELDPERQWRLLWEGMEAKRIRADLFLREDVRDAFAELTRGTFKTAMEPYLGHHAAATLGKLHTRAARAIAPSPLWLMAPEIRVELPFLHPEVIASALRVPLKAKADGAFYRQMLEAADPAIAALPSTNDPRPPGGKRQRRETSPETLAALADDVRSSELVTGLLSERGRQQLLDPESLTRTHAPLRAWRVLNWGSMLVQWIDQHSSRLAVEDFPSAR